MPAVEDMPPPGRWELLRGGAEPEPDIELTAGELVTRLEGPDLRYLRLGGREIVRRLYFAVRDESWGTIPGRCRDLQIQSGPDRFEVTFEMAHHDGGLDLTSHGAISGSPTMVVYQIEATAQTPFLYSRIGLCVLHPPSLAGSSYQAQTPTGRISGRLPQLIEPQRLSDGVLHPLFPSYTELTIDGPEPIATRFEFEGDLFEMEDQRNWTDGSFKTYSTPLALGGPHQARADQHFRQRVTIHLLER